MNLLIATGESPRSNTWAHHLANELVHDFTDVRVLDYERDEEGHIDVTTETDRLLDMMNQEQEYWLFGKSIGNVLVGQALERMDVQLEPRGIIAVGFPYNWIKDRVVVEELMSVRPHIPRKYVQQVHDPAIGSKELYERLRVLELSATGEVSNWSLEVVDGDDHHYDNLPLLVTIIRECKDWFDQSEVM